ncbi:MAG: hypothetical protein HY901_09895 [Deltaproteobacteria bacterium]|nr:hypothetical protein [Deltaproteobacteria bacterium]
MVALLLVGYYVRTKQVLQDEHMGEISHQLRAMQDELAHDTYAGYRAATQHGERIVTDLDLASAHAYLAYTYAILWGEHGDDTEALARSHLAKAQAAKIQHSYLTVAEGYLKLFGGDSKGAEVLLAAAATEPPTVDEGGCARHTFSLLSGALGIIQMHAGDLESAYRNLKAAQAELPADPRTNTALGKVLYHQGAEFQAANAFDTALRCEKDHAGAALGVALMALDLGKLDTAEKFVSRVLAASPAPSQRQLAIAHMANAVLLDQRNKAADADREQALAEGLKSPSKDLYLTLARRLLLIGKKEEAAAAVRQAPVRQWERPGLERDFAAFPSAGGFMAGKVYAETVASPFVCVETSPNAELVVTVDTAGCFGGSSTNLRLSINNQTATLKGEFGLTAGAHDGQPGPLHFPHSQEVALTQEERAQVVRTIGAAATHPESPSTCHSTTSLWARVTWRCADQAGKRPASGSISFGSSECGGLFETGYNRANGVDRAVEALFNRHRLDEARQATMRELHARASGKDGGVDEVP